MSTLGKVCLVLTLLLLLVAMAPIPGKYGGWTPKLLVFHNQWSEKLRDAKKKAQDAVEAKRLAMQEFNKAKTDIEGLTLGWDRYWHIPVRGQQAGPDTPTLAKNGRTLILNNIGSDNGLIPQQYTDDNGAQQLEKPILHAFFSTGEGFVYAGEFRAEEITPKRTQLQPVHPVSPEEVASWNPNAIWRIRGIIPPGHRTAVDDLYSKGRRVGEQTQQMNANIARQQGLLASAQEALEVRKGELLGSPERAVVPSRPEFTEGLLKVNEDVEERRNELLVEIDNLRREIQAAVESRTQAVEQVNQQVNLLPGGTSQYAKANDSQTAAE